MALALAQTRGIQWRWRGGWNHAEANWNWKRIQEQKDNEIIHYSCDI